MTLSDGKLHLAMRKQEVPEMPRDKGYHTYTSAAVKSKTTVRYGYFEVKCRPMKSHGSSSFWFYDSTPELWTEIDVFEIGGGAPGFEKKYNMNVHVFRTPTEKKHWSRHAHWTAPSNLADNYHVYGLQWDKDMIKWYFDGVLVRRLDNTHWHQPLTLNFDSETMPDWFGLPKDSDLPSTYSIEYVRAWKKKDATETSEKTIIPAKGEYKGYKWLIDQHHLLWWDNEPYVRYGFTGNGAIEKFMKLRFDQFNVCPSEDLWVFSKNRADNRRAIDQVNEFTDELTRRGATYYAGLNSLWPWKASGKVAKEDMVKSVFKHSWDVSIFAGTEYSLRLSTVTEREGMFEKGLAKAYLFDMDEGVYTDISDRLTKITAAEEKVTESPGEIMTIRKSTFFFEPIKLPDSRDLRVSILIDLYSAMVPHVYPSSFPALWKPAIKQYYLNGLSNFQKAYSKKGLRGMMFGDEINSHKVSMFHAKSYLDFRDDEIALEAYRGWLENEFRSIADLNERLRTKYEDFEQVNWYICIYPFLKSDEDDDNRSDRINHTFGLFDSADQLEKTDRLQEEFRIWFFGYWLARYGKMAKEVMGDVPVFIASAGMGGKAENYLQIHKQALAQGLDGLIRNHYGYAERTSEGKLSSYEVWSNARFPLETVTELLDAVQKHCGRTKTYFANEFGRPKKGGFDDFGLGEEFSFGSKEDLRNFLRVLISNGYKGFNMFKINPNVPAAQKEVKWLAELKDEIIERAIKTKKYEKYERIDKRQALSIAKKHPRLQRLIQKYPGIRTSVSFNEHYDVWIVEFILEDREVGFASVGNDGRVLETDVKKNGEIEDDDHDSTQ